MTKKLKLEIYCRKQNIKKICVKKSHQIHPLTLYSNGDVIDNHKSSKQQLKDYELLSLLATKEVDTKLDTCLVLAYRFKIIAFETNILKLGYHLSRFLALAGNSLHSPLIKDAKPNNDLYYTPMTYNKWLLECNIKQLANFIQETRKQTKASDNIQATDEVNYITTLANQKRSWTEARTYNESLQLAKDNDSHRYLEQTEEYT